MNEQLLLGTMEEEQQPASIVEPAINKKWLPFTQLTCLYVQGVTEEQMELHRIAPTMARITLDGKTYFRMKDCRAWTSTGEQAGCYLWEGYGDRKKKEFGIT